MFAVTSYHINDLKVEDVIVKPITRSSPKSKFIYYRVPIATMSKNGQHTGLVIKFNESFSSGIRCFSDKEDATRKSYQLPINLFDMHSETLEQDKANVKKLYDIIEKIKNSIIDNFHEDIKTLERTQNITIKGIPKKEGLPHVIEKLDKFIYMPDDETRSPIINPKLVVEGAGIKSTILLGKKGSNKVKRVNIGDISHLICYEAKEYHGMRVVPAILLDSVYIKSNFAEFTIQCKIYETVIFPIETVKQQILSEYIIDGEDEATDSEAEDETSGDDEELPNENPVLVRANANTGGGVFDSDTESESEDEEVTPPAPQVPEVKPVVRRGRKAVK